jgi:hypothetical protein
LRYEINDDISIPSIVKLAQEINVVAHLLSQ